VRAARERPWITGAIAALLVLLLLVGMAGGATLAGASGRQRVGRPSRDTSVGELTALRIQLETAGTRNSYLTGEVAVLQARLAGVQRSPAPPGNKKKP
jgi:hypothetical protein